MTLAGANNCTEMTWKGRERRERSWSGWFWSDGIFFSEAQMLGLTEKRLLEVMNNYKDEDKTVEQFKSNYGGWVGLSIGGANGTGLTSFAKYQNIFKTGCKKALTVEQLADGGVSVWIGTPYVYGGIEEKYGLKQFELKAKSGENLVELYELMEEYIKGTELLPTIRFTGMYDETPTRLRKKFFPRVRKEKKLVTVPFQFAIEIFKDGNRLGRLQRFTRGGSFNYHYSGGGKRYNTEAEANRRAKIANGKRGDCEFKVEKVEQERSVWVNV